MWKFNPFKPGSIVGTGMFAGRTDELRDINRALFQTKNRNPFHFLIHGERGIGKSSLMFYVKIVATGKITGWNNDTLNFLTIEVDLDPTTTFNEIVRKIGVDLGRKVAERQTVKAAAKGLWDFVKRWEVCGVKYNSAEQNDTDLVEDLADSFTKTLEQLGTDVDGAVILIDEADKPSASANLGGFLKLFTERLTKRSCDRVAIGISGLTAVIDKIKQGHESSPRILTHILLEPLLAEERKEVIMRGLEEANSHPANANHTTTINPDALEWIAHVSEGYPHFIQQYAFSALETDTDNVIDIRDVQSGAYKENGALDQLGISYFEDMYTGKIDSDEYRKVLHVMAKHTEEYMSRKDIGKEAGLKETTLSNALRALKDRGIVIANQEKSGFYKLPTNSFAAWIRAKAKREEERAKTKTLF